MTVVLVNATTDKGVITNAVAMFRDQSLVQLRAHDLLHSQLLSRHLNQHQLPRLVLLYVHGTT